MPKKKAPPERGQRLLTLEELAAELRAIGVQPERVLGMALGGERIARTVEPFDPVEALKKDRLAIYSLRVLDALVNASDWARLTIDAVAPQRRGYARLVREASRVLTAPTPDAKVNARIAAAWDVLAMHRAHEALADALEEQYGGRASEVAWERLAARRGEEAATLKDRVTRAKKAAPHLPWPKLRRRGRKAW